MVLKYLRNSQSQRNSEGTMLKSIIVLLLRNIVPILLNKLVTDDKHPSVTEGMVRDYEVKVGVPEGARAKRIIKRQKK